MVIKMLKNEKGSVLVMMIAMTFIVGYLLLLLATQIETRVASYERTRTYLSLNVIEQEGLLQLEDFLSNMAEPENFTVLFYLRDGGKMWINGEKVGNSFAISYQIMYNSIIRARRLRFCLELGTINWDAF